MSKSTRSTRVELEYKKLVLLCQIGVFEQLLKTWPGFGADRLNEGNSPIEAGLQSMKIRINEIDDALLALEEPPEHTHA